MPPLRHPPAVPVLEPPVADLSAGQPHPGESLCGYRIIRMIGRGTRASVYLGFSESTADSGEPSTAALKVFREGTTNVSAELDALARAAHPHVVRLIDVASTPIGEPCLVMERLARGSIADLLRVRSALSPGEVVTILAPIAVAIDALHESGIVHGGISARSVLFRESGAPVLAAFGRVQLIASGLPSASLAADDGVVRDRADLAALALLVLDRAGMDPDIVPDPLALDRFGETLALRLFDAAAATPVRFGSDGAEASAVPQRIRPGMPESVAVGRARELAARAMRQARTVRTPVWVAVASVAIALVAALVLVPGDAPAAVEVEVEPTVEETFVPTEPDGPITGDDPVAALSSLLDARDACIAAISIVCLDGVDQQGSQALDVDVAIVRGIQDGGEIPDDATIPVGEITLVERLGDTALLDVDAKGADSEPASVLVIRTEAGWRIRDYLRDQ